MSTQFFVDQPTGTFADHLRAIGVAKVISSWQAKLKQRGLVTIGQKNGVYCIEASATLTEDEIAQTGPFLVGQGMPLGSKSQQEKAQKEGKDLGRFFDYTAEVERRDAWRKALNNLDSKSQKRYRKNPKTPEFEGFPSPPDSLLDLYIAINHFKSAGNYNDLLAIWFADNNKEAFQENIRLILATFSQTPNAPLPEKIDTTQVQMINPGSGKGVFSAKADALRSGNLSSHWLDEYLKFIGFFAIATPIMLNGAKDRKTYVLRIRRANIAVLDEVMGKFRTSFRGGSSLKADIMASLQFTLTFIEYIGRALHQDDPNDPLLQLRGGKPLVVTDIAEGFDVGFYKDMGSAYATMNLSTINFPNWLAPITSEEDTSTVGTLINEHISAISSIRTRKGEEQSDEVQLLQRYRDFLSGHDPLNFFDFAAHFGSYALGHMRDNLYISRFTTQGMENFLTMADKPEKKLGPILSKSGFKEIATAIRRATVSAQRLASISNTRYPYEVRYGLGLDLLRSAMYPETFIATLGEFIQSYNAESARIDERIAKKTLADMPQYHRARITTSAIDDIVALIDEHSSEVVCKMLVAYGYARDSYTGESGDDKSNDAPIQL